MSTKILGNEELNILRAKTPYSLPDNPSDKGFNARQIKTKFWEGYLLLFNWLKDTQASLNNDFATTNSALLNESKRIDVILTYFSNGKANFAVRDRNNNIIDETYELKSEASSKFNQLIADIQSVSSASGNKITGSQNINADGIQYTITLSNTQNANLSTATQYLPLATTLKAGLLSGSDKEKINNLESDLTNFLANAKAYTDEKLKRDNIVNILGAASHTLIGLLTSEDKKKIDALYALLGEKEDADTVVNTINEVLAIFSNYPEGVDIVSQLEKKVNYSDVINTLDSEETSKPLSAKMGKELKTEVDTKAELAYVNEELDKKALKSDILVIEEAVTAQESEITTTQNEGDKLVDEIVGYIDGSPRGNYASLSALQSAFPSGAQGVYVTTDNGHWNYYNNGWKDGGVYQAKEIADDSINYNKFTSVIQNSIINTQESYEENETYSFDVVNSYISYSNGSIVSFNDAKATDYILIDADAIYKVTGGAYSGSCIVAYYDADKNFIKADYYVGDGRSSDTYRCLNNDYIKPLSSAKYMRFSSMQNNTATKYANKNASVTKCKPISVYNEVDKIKETENIIFDITSTLSKYLIDQKIVTTSGYTFDNEAGSEVYAFIPVKSGEIYYITSRSQYAACNIITYDNNGNVVRVIQHGDGKLYVNEEFIIQPNEAKMTVGSYQGRRNSTAAAQFRNQVVIKKLTNNINDYLEVHNSENILFGKKYVACGDSFTSGDFNGATEPINELYDASLHSYKTYPALIAKRNNMKLENMAKNGSTCSTAKGNTNAFVDTTWASSYVNIPEDADYITIAFGLNETNDEYIGTINDTSPNTIYGAYNIILEWLLINRPKAKIGIIATDAWFNVKQRNALKLLSHKWGVSFLDLKGADVPLLTGGKYSEDGYTVSNTAVNNRNSQYQVSSSNSHPNLEGHRVRSTIIENWMRKM